MRIKMLIILSLFVLGGCAGKTEFEKKIVGTWKPTLAVLNGKEIRNFEGEHRIYFEKGGEYRSLKGGDITEKGSWTINDKVLVTKTIKVQAAEKKESTSNLNIRKLTKNKLVLYHGKGKFQLEAHFEKVEK